MAEWLVENPYQTRLDAGLAETAIDILRAKSKAFEEGSLAQLQKVMEKIAGHHLLEAWEWAELRHEAGL